MTFLLIAAKLISAQFTVHLICAGNSYMMLDEKKEYLKNCHQIVMFGDIVIYDDSSIAQ